MKRGRKEKPFRGISEAELAVLAALWKAPGAPNELQERLARIGPGWAYTTVQTLLHRLLAKGFVERKRVGVAQIYSAAVDRDELLARHVSDLATRLCDGAMSPLLLSLVKTRRFSKGDLARFRALIDEEPGVRRGAPAQTPKSEAPRTDGPKSGR